MLYICRVIRTFVFVLLICTYMCMCLSQVISLPPQLRTKSDLFQQLQLAQEVEWWAACKLGNTTFSFVSPRHGASYYNYISSSSIYFFSILAKMSEENLGLSYRNKEIVVSSVRIYWQVICKGKANLGLDKIIKNYYHLLEN